MLHVVLYHPTIPPNTGNIARQCVGMQCRLHLVGPLRFDLSSKAVRRAGLDYWDHVDLVEHADPEAFLRWLDGRSPWLVSKYGHMRYDKPIYSDEDILVFGSELKGLPSSWYRRWPDRTIHVPILGPIRSYNLANTVSLVLGQVCIKAGIYDRCYAAGESPLPIKS